MLHAHGPASLAGPLRDEFRLWLAGRAFAEATQRTYYKRARGYLKWLVATDTHPQAFTDTPARDAAVLDYLETTGAATRKVTLAAIRALYDWLDLGPLDVDAEPVDQVRPRTLTDTEQGRVLDAAAARSARDYALMVLWLDAGPRPSEVRRLNLDDAQLSARGGRVLLTAPTGAQRWAQLGQAATWVLMGWKTERNALLGRRSERAFFLTMNRYGRIRDDQSLEYIVTEIGKAAGIDALTPSTLRATVEHRLRTSGLAESEVLARMGQTYVNRPRVRALLGDTSPGQPTRSHPHAETSPGQLSFDLI